MWNGCFDTMANNHGEDEIWTQHAKKPDRSFNHRDIIPTIKLEWTISGFPLLFCTMFKLVIRETRRLNGALPCSGIFKLTGFYCPIKAFVSLKTCLRWLIPGRVESELDSRQSQCLWYYHGGWTSSTKGRIPNQPLNYKCHTFTKEQRFRGV